MQKKILIIAGYKLFPATTGGSFYQLAYIEKQMHDFDISIIVTQENIAKADMKDFCERFHKVRVIKAGRAGKGGFNKLTKGVLKLFRKVSRGNWPARLRKVPKAAEMVIKDTQYVEEIAAIVKADNYDIIQSEHIINLSLIPLLPANSLKVFVHYEVFYARALQDMERMHYKPAYIKYINEIVKATEVACLNQYDGVITLSEHDRELLVEAGVTTPIRPSHCLAIKETDLKKIFLPESAPHLLFLGSGDHFPNSDGLAWFLQDIFPNIVNELPTIKVMVTGNWSKGFKERYKHLPITFTGYVDSLDELLKTGILIAPIRIGAGGIHIKVISAMTKGVPVISSAIGASGIPHIKHGHDIYITDDAAEFANYTIELIKKPELRKQLSDNIFDTCVTISEQGDFADERAADYQFFEELRSSKNVK